VPPPTERSAAQLLGCRRGGVYRGPVILEFSGELFSWRGPSPFHFIAVPDDESAEIEAVSRMVTYGWGVIPVVAGIGRTEWRTSLFPKDGGYLVPVKDRVRKAEAIALGDVVAVRLHVTGA
jgi:hypothetical protein